MRASRTTRAWALGALIAVAAAGGCTSSAHPKPAAAGSNQAPIGTPTPTPAAAQSATVWLCRPGSRPDPCASDRTATVVDASGARHREPPTDDGQPIDCFYVYPTVSTETTPNADLTVQPAETDVAIAQASRFSQVCRVWAPMYRQRTLSDLFNLRDGAVDSLPNRTAYASVLAAWRDYLAHDNHGRKVVFIGHSQGAAMLVRLLRAQIDPNPALRRKVVLAILLGANVTVRTGELTGGSFAHLPLCARRAESGCVIAYSSFPSQPPPLALFGRPGAGVSALSGETATTGLSVACVNPVGIAAATGFLHPYVPSSALPGSGVPTPWVAPVGQYTATCKHGDGATWLQVVATVPSARSKALLSQSLGPVWGYHIVDVTIALGDLVTDVQLASVGPTS